jgi:hypothetical protein
MCSVLTIGNYRGCDAAYLKQNWYIVVSDLNAKALQLMKINV